VGALEDRQRERLRPAGNVARDEDRGSEFSERAGERQEGAGEDPAPRERQGDAAERRRRGIAEFSENRVLSIIRCARFAKIRVSLP